MEQKQKSKKSEVLPCILRLGRYNRIKKSPIRPATVKQIEYLKYLIGEENIDETLTVREASKIIEFLVGDKNAKNGAGSDGAGEVDTEQVGCNRV